MMSTMVRPLINSLITKITQFAKTQIKDEKKKALFCRFLSLFYSHASESDLKNRSIAELFGMAYTHWSLACLPRKTNQVLVRAFNPDEKKEGWAATHTIVEVMMKDMPFIVDSIRMEMSRLGYNVHLMIHMGGMKVVRDNKGCVTDIGLYEIANTSEKSSSIESPVYLEIDRQTNPSALLELQENVKRILMDVQVVVADWMPMQQRVSESIEELSAAKNLLTAEMQESVAFLQWLLDQQFTFLCVRDYEVVGSGATLALQLVSGSGLGVLRDESESKVRRLFTEVPDAARESMLSNKQLLLISKTNTISTVHRQVYTDYIGIKRSDQDGKLIGERRVIGLYTSTAYSSHPRQIPFLRHKVASVLEKSKLPPKSHAGKDLMHILETFPRDDLLQASVEDLYRIAMGILNLQDRKKLSLFVREDDFGRYVSCLVYVPRDNFNSQLISRLQDELMKAFHGIEANYSTYFYTPVLTRIHYNIRLDSKKKLHYSFDELQTRLQELAKSWQDGFREAVIDFYGEEKGNDIFNRYRDAFSIAYRDAFSPMLAVADIEHIEALKSGPVLGMSLYPSVS